MEGIKDSAARTAIVEFCNELVTQDAPMIDGQNKPPEHFFLDLAEQCDLRALNAMVSLYGRRAPDYVHEARDRLRRAIKQGL